VKGLIINNQFLKEDYAEPMKSYSFLVK